MLSISDRRIDNLSSMCIYWVETMGDFESVRSPNTEVVNRERKSTLITAITLLFGLFAPVAMMVYYYGSLYIIVQSLFWTYSSYTSIYPNSYSGFSMVPPAVYIMMFPFVLFRLVPVSQIYRYYQGKTTRRRTVITFFIGDGISLSYALYAVFMITYGMDTRIIPIIAQIIFGAIMVWRFPFQEPRIPWDTVLEEGKWWDKDERSPQEKENPKDKDELW